MHALGRGLYTQAPVCVSSLCSWFFLPSTMLQNVITGEYRQPHLACVTVAFSASCNALKQARRHNASASAALQRLSSRFGVFAAWGWSTNDDIMRRPCLRDGVGTGELRSVSRARLTHSGKDWSVVFVKGCSCSKVTVRVPRAAAPIWLPTVCKTVYSIKIGLLFL
uniref:Putative secreted protein n=1 Tax=Ixodes ricinus TaxID=34613 RepID=A0A6B0UXN4_IXORI